MTSPTVTSKCIRPAGSRFCRFNRAQMQKHLIFSLLFFFGGSTRLCSGWCWIHYGARAGPEPSAGILPPQPPECACSQEEAPHSERKARGGNGASVLSASGLCSLSLGTRKFSLMMLCTAGTRSPVPTRGKAPWRGFVPFQKAPEQQATVHTGPPGARGRGQLTKRIRV